MPRTGIWCLPAYIISWVPHWIMLFFLNSWWLLHCDDSPLESACTTRLCPDMCFWSKYQPSVVTRRLFNTFQESSQCGHPSQGLGQGLVTLLYSTLSQYKTIHPGPTVYCAIINKFLGRYRGALALGILQCTVNQFGQLNTAIWLVGREQTELNYVIKCLQWWAEGSPFWVTW